MSSSAFVVTEKEHLCLTWATNALAYALIDDGNFKKAFGLVYPPGVSAHSLSTDMIAFGNRLVTLLQSRLRGQAVTLALDGGKIHKKVQSMSVICDGKAYYLAACTVLHNDNESILKVLEKGHDFLAQSGANLVAVVGDNHSGVQLAIDKFVDKYPKVFKIRCAAHSLQLLMGDLYKVYPMPTAVRLGNMILGHFNDVDAAKKLEDVQRAAGKEPLKLVKPCETRWNSTCDAHERMLRLEPFIQTVVGIPRSDFEAMKLAVTAMKVLAVATDRVQRDEANLDVVQREMDTIEKHFRYARLMWIIACSML